MSTPVTIRTWKLVLSAVFVVAVFLYIGWTTSELVFAYREIKRAHVFPTHVSTVGWVGGERALKQELSSEAALGSFAADNSARIVIAGTAASVSSGGGAVTTPAPHESETPAESVSEESALSGDDDKKEAAPAADENETTETIEPTASEVPEVPTESTDVSAETPAEDESAPAAAEPVVPETTPVPAEETSAAPAQTPVSESPVPAAEPASAPEASIFTQVIALTVQNMRAHAWNFLTAIATPVFATTTPEESPAPAQSAEPTATTVSTTTPAAAEAEAEAQPEKAPVSETAENTPAETTETESEDESVATCSILGRECYTIELSGFSVDGALEEKKFEGVELTFSFANLAPENSTADGRLMVRYFHEGRWRHAGEIFLNKEISNASNGGYFTQRLDEIEGWDDLADVKVVFEYERGDETAPAELYLDSAWIDALYKERAQDVLEGDVDDPEVAANIAFNLAEDGDSNTLVLGDGERITFGFVDDVNEDRLVMRADRASYAGAETGVGGKVVYVSVTNTTAQRGAFRLYGTFPESGGTVREVYQFLRNVPETTETPVFEDVTYFCAAGWLLASSTESYLCAETGEERTCSWLNEAEDNCLVPDVPVGVTETVAYENEWVAAGVADTQSDKTIAKELPDGYVIRQATTDAFEILPDQTVYFKVVLDEVGAQHFALYAKGERLLGDLDSNLLREETEWNADVKKEKQMRKKVNDHLTKKTLFDGDELPEFQFKFKSQRPLPVRLLQRLLGKTQVFAVEEAYLTYEGGEKERIPISVVYDENGEWTLKFENRPRGFRPGRYSLEFTLKEGGETYTDSTEFYWGVLALNSNKTVYAPGETVHFMMAALDAVGKTICDAPLWLTVTDPAGAEQEVEVQQSGECGPDNVVDVADYLSDYLAGGVGTYSVMLAHMGADGGILHQTLDTFDVREQMPFVIERMGATRIYPVANYRMTLRLTATNDFEGEFIEAVPEDFIITDMGSAESRMYGNAKRLAWPVLLKAGETMTVSYEYDAPDRSPYLYLLGPAEVRAGEGLPFVEARQWKLASDAVGNMLLYWDQTWIPSGWTCVSCLPGDPFYQRFIVGSSTPGVNGGAATHTHTATGAVAASSGSTGVDNNTVATPSVGHSHTYTPTIGTGSNLPPYHNLVVIQSNTAGEPALIPTGAIAIFDASVPSGWTQYNTANGQYLRPEATSTVNSTGGSATHTHTITGTTGAAAGTINLRNPGTTLAVAAVSHTHTVSSNTGSVNNEPPYIEVVLGKLNATTTATNDMIAMWNADPSPGWDTVSSSSEPFENRFLKASTTYSGTGGAETHSHVDVTGITSGGPSGTTNRDSSPPDVTTASNNHTHSVNVTNFSTSSHLPPYRTAVFAKRAGGPPPSSITLYDVPFDNEKHDDSTPAIEFTAGTTSGSNTLVYQVQWDDDADLETSPLGDRASDDESGCSPNCFENLTTPLDLAPFDEGDRIRFTIQTSLVSGTTYYFRVRAQNDGGTDWSNWSTTTSFTYSADTDPSQWFQTEDAQFDTDTLSNTETFGSNSVRIITDDPVEALVAYAEGTTQTPAYRIWDGSAWGSEAYAQSVGGTIQWTVTRAGTQRDEYVLGTQDASNDVNVQVYNGTSTTWGNLQEVTTTISDTTARGFDIAYETSSGDAIVAYCDGDADPSYYVWNGSSWTGPTTINLSLTNNCEWIKLASDPTSDEIVLVARDTAASATDYEAMVWDGSAWGNGQTLGSMTDVLHEGIAVEYEESGDQAVVTTSNGSNSNFVWTSWNGTEWSVPTTQTLGDDFESGVLVHDDGSDNLALCYGDQDDDLGVVRWDGVGWNTVQEIDLGGNTGAGGLIDGRPISCEFETTAGRDGYIMVPYSDTTNGRYQYWDGATFSTEASISTIQDAWTVSSVRTGEGKILAMFHDDVNTRYDFSYWDGASWSALQTLEDTTSIGAEPYREPISMAAKVYQPLTGTITSTPIEFDFVSGQPSWGEVSWATTEPNGTDVLVRVLDGSTGTCGSVIGGLSGNVAGFGATSSPVNLSGLSTTTYTALCLEATLSSGNETTPTLDDWTVRWEREPYLTQTNFRWYANTAALTPTDVWPLGGADLNENEAISESTAPVSGTVLRLRMAVLDENVAVSASSIALRLQYAVGATCTADLAWLDVGAVGSTTAAWRGYDNAGVSDGATLSSTLLAGSDVAASYEEANDSALNPNSISVNQEGEWDWAIQHNALAGTSYCFRVVDTAGEAINEYDQYPALVTNQKSAAPVLDKPFDNEQTASTTPWFEFAAEDPEGNDLTYQIQVDDDYAFGSTLLDRDSQTNFSEFTNIVTPSDKDPFNSSQTMRFVPTTALSDGTTYYWRVRAKDRNASVEWSDWSTVQSVTINTSTTITTWYQTTQEQFDIDSFEDTESTASDDVILTTGFTTGTTTGPTIDFDWKTTGNAWGELSWNENETNGDIRYHIEYFDGSEWTLVPDSFLSGNASGFGGSSTSLLGLDPTEHNQIRVRANFTDLGGTPRLLDWTVEWGFAVEQPTQTALFDNEKTGTTTPTFRFVSTDPQDDDLNYEFAWSTTPDFAASTTRSSAAHAGFANTVTGGDTFPFNSGETVSFTIQSGDALTNGQTYWWRVRAIDPLGGNVPSVWSPGRSFTVDTSVIVSTWFQTTDEQFDTDTLNDIETTGSDSVEITSTIREAFTAYAEGTAQVPRYRIWNGVSWGTEASALSIGDTIRFVEAAAAPTRDEYMVATIGSTAVVDAQVYDGDTDSFGNMTEIVAAVPDVSQRGMDIAYETSSGDAMVVACSGTEAVYKTWDGSSWSAQNPITLAVTANCEWVQLAADPTSDEIILVVRDAITGATDYEALVWNGSSWGNSMTMGSMAEANDEGIAVEYEESGNQAVVVVSNGGTAGFAWNSWNGSSWSGASTQALQDDFEAGRLVRDLGSDNMALCSIDNDGHIALVRWTGSSNSWSAFQSIDGTTPFGNSKAGRPVTCEFETTAGRDGYIMVPWSDTADVWYRYWDGSALSTDADPGTISDSWELRSTRTGDGNVLMVAYDDANTEYDFSYWNGTSWSAEQVLETTSIATLTQRPVPIDLVARRYPSFTSGTVISSAIDFDDGSGPKWEEFSFNDTTPGSSQILYQVQYFASTSEWALIPDAEISGNSVGTTTTPIDISNLNRTTYNQLRLVANLQCISGDCPTLNDWTVTWSEGVSVSGTAQQYNQSTNLTSGTVAVAVNGVLQAGKTGTISGGTWTIPNVTAFADDIITVFIDGAADSGEAVAITTYDGDGDIAGMSLYERHVTLGSDDNPTLTNANLGAYDNSASSDEDIFHEVDAGNDLVACTLSGCTDVEILVKSGVTYRPDSSSSGNMSTHDIEINGTLTADGNTLTVSGSWDNNGIFTANTSTVLFSATSTTETIDSTGATTSSFNIVTFGQSGTATWNLSSAFDVNGALSVNFGTVSQGAQAITLAGNLTFGASGVWQKGTATTTFDGSGTATWTDNTAAKQDVGTVLVDGTAKTILLGAAAKATNITIGSDDTLSVNNNYALEVQGNWTNNNSFLPLNGTVTFTATTTGRTITPGTSPFYNLVFNGSGGNWAINGTAISTNNDFTITNGIVTLPSGTTTVGGSFAINGGSFMHNNGEVLFSAGSAKTVRPNSSSFYDLTFSGSGSWSFVDANATSSRHTRVAAGTVTLPTGTHVIGGSLFKTGGTITAGTGTVKLTATSPQTVQVGGSSLHNITFDGSGGSWSFVEANVTLTGTATFQSGTTTLPPGTLSVGGSWIVSGGAFSHATGTVTFNSTDTGETINPGSSSFYNLTFNGAGGGWTISENATSTGNTTLTNGASFTLASARALAVGGAFTNSLGGATTTWTGSTLFLNGTTTFAINTKALLGDTYGTLVVGANADVRMWNSQASSTSVNATGSLYSQDHAGIDGDLYIYGEYVATGSEHWSYATDFDGAALTGTERQVDVRVASGSTITSTGTLRMLGVSTATTTVANQGAGTFTFNVTGGTLNAQYYSVRNTDSAGLAISGTPTVTSLANGDFELGVDGGTMLTVAGATIDQNPALEIQAVRFATSTGIATGTNVIASGSPSSYWWFRNHYGNRAGETYDSDPSGNPGNVRWDDSGFVITVSGTVYANHGTTPLGAPACDGSTPVVTVMVNGGASYTGSCNASTGAYSIPNVQFTGDAVLTTYLNTNGGARAVTVTKTPIANITNLDLYENSLIVRHEGGTAMTIENLAFFDASEDTDVFFTAATTSTDTLILAPSAELFVWGGKTFAPNGDVTLTGAGSGDARDGRLFVATSSVFTAAGTESHTIGGGLTLATGATFTPASSTITFTATTTGKIIYSAGSFSLYNLIFNGAGGVWALNNASALTVQNTLAITAGTVSGTGSVIVASGDLTGNGAIVMTGGTFTLQGAGDLGSNTAWQFHNLTLGDGTVATTAKTGTATTTVAGVLNVAASQTLTAGSAAWVFSGAGTPFVLNGSLTVETAPFFFTATTSTNIENASYSALTLAPAAAGNPTYTLLGGTFATDDFTAGDAFPVTVTADTNDPSLNINGDFTIGTGSSFVASGVGALDVGGSWTNNGTFTHSNSEVTFDSTDTGETITPGASSFYDLTFDGVGGGWTVDGHATATRNVALTAGDGFTQASGTALSVGGTFTNSIGGAATTWTGSTLSLTSGTAYSLNTKTDAGDTYGTLVVGANTDVRMWNSQASSTSVDATGSLYSQDHAGVNGDLYIWGDYVKTGGSDYWSYATDFDGTDISATPRQVAVRVASSSSLTFSGGLLDIIGVSTATTTIRNQGAGRYAFSVSGGTLNAGYYELRNLTAPGLNLSGTPTVTSLSNGDFELDLSGGAMMTVDGSVITANPLKVFSRNQFATSSGVTSGTNVVATGSSGSSWKFNLHYGNYDGEILSVDPQGDPGMVRWDDSAADIVIAGNVYSDEGTTVSTACDGSTQNVRLLVEGGGSYTSSCDASTGAYSISDVAFNPNDVLTVFLDDASGGQRAANISVDPITNIADMHLYENRVIVRHEDTAPITIANMAVYDSNDDVDIPFTAVDAGSDTLTLPPNTKLIVWDDKTFAPAGNITLQSGGSGTAWDGTLELRDGATFAAAGTQAHSVGGSLLLGTGATLSPGSATFTFTATTTGKTIALQSSSFYDLVFNGVGGNWAFSGPASTTNDFTITNGTVTLSTGTTTVGGSFQNTGGTFMHNNGALVLNATASGKNIRAGGSNFYNLTVDGVSGAWTFVDTVATTSNNFTVTAGSVTLPATTFTVGGSFVNLGTFTAGINTVRLTAATTSKSVKASGSHFYNLEFAGAGGGWSWEDTNATTTRDLTLTAGDVLLPPNILAVGGSFTTSAGTFSNNFGTVRLTATTTGKTIAPGASPFYNLTLNSSSGGWTISQTATATNDFTLTSAASFTLASGQTMNVGGTFTNGVGGAATTWTGSTLNLNSGTAYSLNTKTTGGDLYDATVVVGAATDIRMWNSAATTTTVDATGSLYSQDHAGVDGDVYIWGGYERVSGSDYWSYATDFDGTALGGSSRQVDVRIASSSSVTVSGGTLNIVGTAAATTTIANQGAGTYAFEASGGTINAQYYSVRNTDATGLELSGTPSITTMSNGDFELGISGGAMLTVAGSVIDANASMNITSMRFATSSGIASGYNIARTGTPISAWTFSGHYGNLDGEDFDNDGGDACGAVRWNDSACLFVNQAHYRWRTDDGGAGAPNSEWYNASWSNRKKVAITNSNATGYSNLPVKIVVAYDADMQSDFDDLRFTDSTGTTSLNYWIESRVNSASSTVWVEVPSLFAEDSADIYMYYGNPSVADAGDGEATFPFFDDFEDDDINEYSGTTGDFDTGTAFNYIGTYGLGAVDPLEQTAGGIRRTGSLMTQNNTVRFFQYIDATQEDEPCTLFAVQGSGQNYAVCLDQYPDERVIIARNVSSNDGSGTVLASTTVTFTTGWYEVVVDWLDDDSIDVTVYNDTGAEFATVSAGDGTHTSGGMGFSYWAQHGGWDFYTAKQYTEVDPTYIFGAEQVDDGATWAENIDTALSGISTGENVRLRFSVQNSGAPLDNQDFHLQYAPKGASLNCESVPFDDYATVPVAGSCGSSPACMTASSQFTDQTSIADLLPYPAFMSFAPGAIMENASNATVDLDVPTNAATEVEYNFEFTGNASANAYCFRVGDDPGTPSQDDLDNYAHVAEAILAHAPEISDFTLNNATNIALTEGATTTVYATGTVTDLNGYADILYATSTIYRSSVGSFCSANANNCYQIASSSCSLSACAGTSCTLSCAADIAYLAEPTDVGSENAADSWLASAAVEDSSGLRDTVTTMPNIVELLTLRGLAIDTGDIDFNEASPGGLGLETGQNTGSTNVQTGLINTGNTEIDIRVYGQDLAGSTDTIAVGEQAYATSTFTYASCSICEFLTGSVETAPDIDVDLPKPTSTSSPITDDLYWGIEIPAGSAAEAYVGQNTFEAIGPGG